MLFALVNDNDDLSHRASTLLVRMCGVVPPQPLINPTIDALFDGIKQSPVCQNYRFIADVQLLINFVVMEGSLEGTASIAKYVETLNNVNRID
jgi:hypothetical protein